MKKQQRSLKRKDYIKQSGKQRSSVNPKIRMRITVSLISLNINLITFTYVYASYFSLLSVVWDRWPPSEHGVSMRILSERYLSMRYKKWEKVCQQVYVNRHWCYTNNENLFKGLLTWSQHAYRVEFWNNGISNNKLAHCSTETEWLLLEASSKRTMQHVYLVTRDSVNLYRV